MLSHPKNAAVAGFLYLQPSLKDRAWQLSQRLGLPLADNVSHFATGKWVLVLANSGLGLRFTGPNAPGPVRVDFTAGAADHRRHYGGGKKQLIAKAVGIEGAYRPAVLDLTAGLGQDAFVLATLRCRVTLIERHPIVYQLLRDGLQRATEQGDEELRRIIAGMTLIEADGGQYLRDVSPFPEVVYFDPMFPEQVKTARVKKAMQALHRLVGQDTDAGSVLAQALQRTRYRVVVKRPRKAPGLHQQYRQLNLPEPGLVLAAKTSRYDIYPLAKLPRR